MPPRPAREARQPGFTPGKEAWRINIERQLSRFCESSELTLAFPPTLSSEERRFVHAHAPKLGLATKSQGAGGGPAAQLLGADLLLAGSPKVVEFNAGPRLTPADRGDFELKRRVVRDFFAAADPAKRCGDPGALLTASGGGPR